MQSIRIIPLGCRATRDRARRLGWAALVMVACSGEIDEGKNGSGSSGGLGGNGAGGAMGASGGAPTAATGGAAATGRGGTVGTVACDGFSGPSQRCTAQEYCCNSSCVAKDQPCAGDAFYCDDAADCPGASCCVTKLGILDGGVQVARCQAACDPDTQLVLCNDPGGGGGCPGGMTCRITATLDPQYGYCCPSGEWCSAT